MAIETYLRVDSAEEAIRRMTEHAGRARFLAGGTDLLTGKPPDVVIDIRGLLSGVRRDGEDMVIGATATITEIGESEELARADGGLLRSCTRVFAHWQIRNAATLGGNIVNAVPCADLVPPLLVLDARCVLVGPEGSREEPLRSLFLGPKESAVGDRLLTEVRFRVPSPGTRSAFLKVGVNDEGLAVVNAAVLLEMDGKTCRRARLSLNSVAPTPIRVDEAEKELEGGPITEERIERAAEIARGVVRPISDQRAGAEYRTHMSAVLTRRVIRMALEGGEA
ncbi:MAG: FAD binding domain-containing protein [Candidatus Eisenbacteria bacterium]|nr:FAD binding domain-containing protein [Candidatus Eisenbacteria bacterium]